MADLETILSSGDILDIKVGGPTIGNKVVTSNQLLSSTSNLIDAVDQLRDDVNAKYMPVIIDTGATLGSQLSRVECEAFIPSPVTTHYYIIIGTTTRFLVVWDGTDYLFERLSRAT